MILTKDGKKRLLKANEIECRVGQKNKDKTKYSVLLYKTARTDMDILDEVFGSYGWQSEHYEVKGKDFCRIGVKIENEWVWKSDCGKDFQRVAEDSEKKDSEKKGLNEYEKSESSDSFKRAGFMWGIGRELYSAPRIWLSSNISDYSLSVAKIGYNEDNDINELVIVSTDKGKATPVFSMKDGKIEKITNVGDEIKEQFNGKEVKTEEQQKAELIVEIKKLGGNEEKICGFFKVGKFEDLSIEQLQKTLEQGKKK